MDANFTFEHPDAEKPAVFRRAALSGNGLDVDVFAKPVVVLELD